MLFRSRPLSRRNILEGRFCVEKRKHRWPRKTERVLYTHFGSTRWFTAPLIYFYVPRCQCRFPRSAFWSAKMNRQRGLGRTRRDHGASASRENLWRGRRRLHQNRKCHFDRSLFVYNTSQRGHSNGRLRESNYFLDSTASTCCRRKFGIQLPDINVLINYFFFINVTFSMHFISLFRIQSK